MPLSDAANVSPVPGKAFWRQRIDGFLATPRYVALVCALALASNMFSLELPVYTVYAALVAYICFFGSSILPLMPVMVCGYVTPSAVNNPGQNAESVFSGAGGVYVAVMGTIIGVSCLYRVIRDRKCYFAKKYKLLPGMLLLSLAYLAGGIGTPGYWDRFGRNILFAFLQCASLMVLYLLFSGGVDWKNAPREYFGWSGFFLGCVLLGQLLWIYLTGDVVSDGVIDRGRIYTGWGIHNNLGGMLAMMIPFAFYLGTKHRKGWLGPVAGFVFLLGVFLSCSRNAILTGCGIYFVGIVLMLYYAKNRKANTVAVLVCLGAAAALVIVFNQRILRLFSDILSLGFDPNSRDSIYGKGMEMFSRYPVFGCSFFSPDLTAWDWATLESFSGFIPPRWHNTVVQLLASCGVVGLAAYLFHRVQTVVLLLRTRHKEAVFIGCSVLALLVCSLFDCHFFNIGPTIFYSIALAVAENCGEKQE